jgi:drug/metabolite transporter (DMT)-like permease
VPFRNWKLLLLTAAAFAASLPFNNVLVAHIPPVSLAACRAILALPIVWLAALLLGSGLPSGRDTWLTALIGGALIVSIPFSAIAWGQQYIASGVGGILYSTMPLITAVIAHFVIRDECLSLKSLFGIAVGILGVTVVIGPNALTSLSSDTVLGAIVTLVAPLSYATGSVMLRQRPASSPLELTVGMFAFGALLLTPLAIFLEGFQFASINFSHAPSLIGLTILGTAAPTFLNYVLVRRAGATNASLVMFFMPAFALLFGVVWLGETLSYNAMLGMCLVVLGSAVATKSAPSGREPAR